MRSPSHRRWRSAAGSCGCSVRGRCRGGRRAALSPPVAWGGVLAFGGLSLAMIAFHVWQGPVRRLIESVIGRFSARLAERASKLAASVALGFRFLEDPKTAPPFALLTALYWA